MPSMSARDEWIISQAEFSLRRLEDEPNKCHIDEAITLCHYLNGEMDAKSAARLITALVRRQAMDDSDRRNMRYRIMELLADTLIHCYEDNERIIDLVLAIQDLPYEGGIKWSRTNFDAYFVRYRDECHKDVAVCKRSAYLTATMYLRGVYEFTEGLAYTPISNVCLETPGLELEIHRSHQWLKVAGSKLAENIQSSDVKAFHRAVRGRSDKVYMIQATMYEHWQHWKKRFLQLSHDENLLSPESRQVAKECHDIMKGLVVNPPHMPWDV